jgi:hypothetical protein
MAVAAQQQMKRKADAEVNTHTNTAKKQKKAPKQPNGNEPFRKPSDWGQKDPIGITQAHIPLTNSEVFRLRGWSWRMGPKDLVFERIEGLKYQGPECESPRGTKFW